VSVESTLLLVLAAVPDQGLRVPERELDHQEGLLPDRPGR
jgi:hypothetical protein